jgi:hypothetical protein
MHTDKHTRTHFLRVGKSNSLSLSLSLSHSHTHTHTHTHTHITGGQVAQLFIAARRERLAQEARGCCEGDSQGVEPGVGSPRRQDQG